jgi:hypothetical protein
MSQPSAELRRAEFLAEQPVGWETALDSCAAPYISSLESAGFECALRYFRACRLPDRS